MEMGNQSATSVDKSAVQSNLTGTLGEARKREADVLYGLVLMFTYGQLALIVWDMVMQLPGMTGLARSVGIPDPGAIHSIGQLTTAYLGFLGLYIGRNALRKYSGQDSDTVPTYVFLGMTRGYFYLSLWGTLCFAAFMLEAFTLISRMPYELVITMSGVTAALFGDKVIKGFLDKRAVGQLQKEADATDSRDAILACVDKNGRITNKECRQVTGLGDAQATNVLARLEKEGVLEQVGQGRYAYYRRKGSKS